jgi:DNA-binding beta-propeller fold protein YncE
MVRLCAACVAVLALLACSSRSAATTPMDRLFTLVGDFRLGDATDRMDYQSFDAGPQRLYIADMGQGKLLVFDTAANRLVRSLDGFSKVTGVLAVPQLHRVYASVPGGGVIASLKVGAGMLGLSSGSGEVAVVDTGSLRVLAHLPGGVFPDGLAYDAKDKRLFVSDELGSAVLAIDATDNRSLAAIATGGEVGNVRYDPISARVYAPIQSRDALAVIDPGALKLVTRYQLPGCAHPHGLMIHPTEAIGYVACDENDVLVTIDLTDGRILTKSTVAHDPDVLAIDSKTMRLYVAGETGILSTFDLTNAASPLPQGEVYAGPGAHSVAVDPTSHRLYLPLADHDGHADLRVLAPKT